jgi:hypothetical protein
MSRVVLPDGTTSTETGPIGESIVAAELAIDAARLPRIPVACRRRLATVQPPVEPPTIGNPVILAAARSAGDLTGLTWRGRCIVMTGQPAGPMPSGPKSGEVTLVGPPSAPGLRAAGWVAIGCASGGDADGFAWPRVLALRGASLLCLFPTSADLDLLRTRAAENRVFVAAVAGEWAVIVAPDATVLARDRGLAVADVDPADAASKTVAPQTHVFDERRPASYRF